MAILGISGSLRASSKNTAQLVAAGVPLYRGLATLPFFNQDFDIEPAPPAVAEFRRLLKESDGVLISSPEYAHGVPGVLKNALDWIVSSGGFVDKPVALVNASLQSTHAQASLKETLTVMMARIVADTRDLNEALQALSEFIESSSAANSDTQPSSVHPHAPEHQLVPPPPGPPDRHR